MEPLPEAGPSAQDWMTRELNVEAIEFRKSFEAIMWKADNIEDVEKFMARSDEHPRFVWLDLLLSSPSKARFGNDSVETELASLMWTQLINYFPDVLHRELFLDDFHFMNLGEKVVDRFGVLHGAVLSGRPEIVRLLSDHRTNAEWIGKAICRPLREFLEPDGQRGLFSLDCFYSIKRAVLWSRLPNPSEYKKVVAFLKAFERAKDSDNDRDLDTVIWTGHGIEEERQAFLYPGNVTEDEWSYDFVWTFLLAWASASGRGDIIERFKNLRPDFFKALSDSQLWKSLFSPSLEALYTNDKAMHEVDLEVTFRKEKPEKRLMVARIVKIVNQVMTVVEVSTAHFDLFMQLCSMYSISCRAPSSHPRPNFCNDGWKAIHLAAVVGDHAVLEALITSYDLVLRTFPAEWKIKVKDGSGHTTIRRYLQDSLCDTLLMTPLHHAVLWNHLHVAKLLLKWDFFFLSHVNALDIFQRTALQLACSDSARVSILKELVMRLGIDTNTKDCCGYTPLHWAVYVGAVDVVRILVSQATGIRPMAKSGKGQHPHQLAEDLDLVKKKDIQALLESISEVKDGVERVYRDRQVYVDAANAILVGAALIASVTFGGWLQLPLGNGQESTHTRVRVYWVFNSLSFFLAICTVMAGAETVLPRSDVYIEDAVESIRTWLVSTAFMFICSIVFVLGAFAAAGFASSSLVYHLNSNMISTTSLGTAICSLLGISFCLRLFRIGHIQWWKKMQNTLNWLKQGACLSDTSTHIRKLFRDLYFPPLKESNGGQDKASLQVVRTSYKDLIALEYGNNKLPERLTEILHTLSEQQVCHIRRCYRGLELESTVSREWLNTNFLPEYTIMWKTILDRLKVLGTAPRRRKHSSILFHDDIGEFKTRSGTESLEKYGVLRVEKDRELLKHLEILNLRGHEDYERTKNVQVIELKMPICCEECVEYVEEALYAMRGVRTVEANIFAEKVIVICCNVSPADVLLEARRVFKKSRFWLKDVDDINPEIRGPHSAPVATNVLP